MRSFDSRWDYDRFSHEVLHQRRYVHTPFVRRFLGTVLKTSRNREYRLCAGQSLWRAQLPATRLEPDGKGACPQKPEEMMPRDDWAYENRANPKGISCLYMADDKETAMGEMRPWIGADISLAHLVTSRDVRIIDFIAEGALEGDDPLDPRSYEELEGSDRERAVWLEMSRAFSVPVIRSDKLADYAPTQVLSELFRSHGFDGVRYKSALGKGHNIAVFDKTCVTIRSIAAFTTHAVRYDFRQVGAERSASTFPSPLEC